MLNKKKITALFIILLAVIFLLPDIAFAQGDVFGVNDLTNTNLGTKDLRDTIAGIINIFLGFLGILATLIVLYGGYIWMTSKGNADQIDKAKRIIINGVIGLVIVMSSYAIARFVLREGGDATTGPGGGGGGGYHGGIGLGGAVLENHYPARNARDISRNTNIYITFKEPMSLDFVVNAGCNYVDPDYTECLDDSYIRLFDEDNVEVAGLDMMLRYDAENKVFEINPYGADPDNHLGTPDGDVRYKMVLDGLETVNGQAAFPFTGFYDWNFIVNNELDLTPPQVISVLPPNSTIENPRNSAVQINFSEAVNPLFAAGVYTGNPPPPDFTNITVSGGAGVIAGSYLISNQYRTVEFVTDELCGMNSCGGEVYCLPGAQQLDANVTDIIRDMSGNQLDSNDNGIGGEGIVDNYPWSFNTNDTIDLTSPIITSMDSGAGLLLNDPIEATFSKNLLSSSINSNNISLIRAVAGDTNYWLRLINNNIVSIRHDKFDPLTNYSPTFLSGIQDSTQNCWYPCECDDPVDGSCSCDTPVCSGVNCIGGDI